MKICVVTYADRFWRLCLKSFEKTKQEFCNKHNIDFHVVNIDVTDNEKTGWKKVGIVQHFLKTYDVVYITDYDSVFINDIDIERLIPPGDMICGYNKNVGYLLGCSIFRNTTRVNHVLEKLAISTFSRKTFLAEEAAFNEIIKTFPLDIKIDDSINHIHNFTAGTPEFMIHYATLGNPLEIKILYDERCLKG